MIKLLAQALVKDLKIVALIGKLGIKTVKLKLLEEIIRKKNK